MARVLNAIRLSAAEIELLDSEHESSHCVVALALGFPLLSATMEQMYYAPEPNSPIRWPADVVALRPASTIARKVVISFAGRHAERLRMGPHFPCAGFDMRDVQKLSGQREDHPDNRALDDLAGMLVQRLHGAIVALGVELRQHRGLSGFAATKLLAKSLGLALPRFAKAMA